MRAATQLCDHGAHRRAGGRGPAGRAGARRGLCEAGADMLFPEASPTRRCTPSLPARRRAGAGQYDRVWQNAAADAAELGRAGVDMVLYPLSAFRAMSAAACACTARSAEGHPGSRAAQMQTRAELYDVLDYHAYEAKAGRAVCKEKTNE
jgi:methylisocitrate lyase